MRWKFRRRNFMWRNLTWRNIMYQNLTRWKFHAAKFPAAKFSVANFNLAKFYEAKFTAMKLPAAKFKRGKNPVYFLLKSSKALKILFFIFLKNHRKFNNFCIKLEIPRFKEKLLISWDFTLFIRKNGKASERVMFLAKKYKKIIFLPFTASF